MWNLVAITLLFIIIIIFRKHCIFILIITLLLSYVVQYSEFHYKYIFLKYPEYKRKTLGYLFEVEPFAVTGFILGFYRIIDILQKNKIKTLVLSVIIYNVIANYKIYSNLIIINIRNN